MITLRTRDITLGLMKVLVKQSVITQEEYNEVEELFHIATSKKKELNILKKADAAKQLNMSGKKLMELVEKGYITPLSLQGTSEVKFSDIELNRYIHNVQPNQDKDWTTIE